LAKDLLSSLMSSENEASNFWSDLRFLQAAALDALSRGQSLFPRLLCNVMIVSLPLWWRDLPRKLSLEATRYRSFEYTLYMERREVYAARQDSRINTILSSDAAILFKTLYIKERRRKFD
jgi:hypothetical protein